MKIKKRINKPEKAHFILYIRLNSWHPCLTVKLLKSNLYHRSTLYYVYMPFPTTVFYTPLTSVLTSLKFNTGNADEELHFGHVISA